MYPRKSRQIIVAGGGVALTGSLPGQDAIGDTRDLAAKVRDANCVDTTALILANA
jgi:hypothetical protein